MLESSLNPCGIPWDNCLVDDSKGDSFRVIPPLGTTKDVLLEAVLNTLAWELRKHNHAEGPGSNRLIRLRVALNAGEINLAGDDADGRPLEVLARLLDAPRLRQALETASADTPLALIMSEHYYEDTVPFSSLTILKQEFEMVDVNVKEYQARAYLIVPTFAVRTRPAAQP
jgi:hypothetical protein